MDPQYKSLSLEEKAKFKGINERYKNLAKQIREQIFPTLDRAAVAAQEIRNITGKYSENELTIIKGLELLAHLEPVNEVKKEVDEEIVKRTPSTPHGMYICDECEIRSVYLVDQEVQLMHQNSQIYHCELCERTGPMEELLTTSEIGRLRLI